MTCQHFKCVKSVNCGKICKYFLYDLCAKIDLYQLHCICFSCFEHKIFMSMSFVIRDQLNECMNEYLNVKCKDFYLNFS